MEPTNVIGANVLAPNNGRVIYSGSATKDDATKLMKGLAAENFFARPGAAVLLSKSASGTTISVPVEIGRKGLSEGPSASAGLRECQARAETGCAGAGVSMERSAGTLRRLRRPG